MKIQSLLQQSVASLSQIEQSIVIHKSSLHRLDLASIESVLREIEKIKNERGQVAEVESHMQNRLY